MLWGHAVESYRRCKSGSNRKTGAEYSDLALHSKHSFSTLSYSLYRKTNKALDEFSNAVVLLCIQYCAKHTIQNVMRLKVKRKSLGSLHTKDLAQPKMQMNSETFFQGNSMICSGLFQGLKEDQEKKLWGIFLIRLFQLRKSPDLNIRTKYMHRLVTNNCAKYRHHCYQNIIT